jgi:hypothetical protein
VPIDPGSYVSAFGLILKDFVRLTAYVEPTDANLRTFLHRLYEVILRACTEFESVCKDALVDRGSTKTRPEMNINDYRTLESSLQLEVTEVGWHLWMPLPKYVQPFRNWQTVSPPLAWYAGYNRVKHNRNSDFSRSNLENACLAVSGLFATLARLDLFPAGRPGQYQINGPGTVDDHYPSYPQLSFRRPP